MAAAANPEEIDLDDGAAADPQEIDLDAAEEANPEEIDLDDVPSDGEAAAMDVGGETLATDEVPEGDPGPDAEAAPVAVAEHEAAAATNSVEIELLA